MKLNDTEKRMLSGEYGDIVKKSIEILVKLGEIYGAEKLIKIDNVHSPGVSYRVTGDAGLNFVKGAARDFKKKVNCIMTLNTIGIDFDKPVELGFSKEFIDKQIELLDAYESIGSIGTYTCTPYLIGNFPRYGEHVAWGESSAVAFANSVCGARTNREGGPTALAAALTGRVPEYGFHLDENRRGDHLIKVEASLTSDCDYAALGYFVGQKVGSKIPVFQGIKNPTQDNLKALSAALASSGAIALYHIFGVTPEIIKNEKLLMDDAKEILYSEKEAAEVFSKFHHTGKVDMVVLGCPHCSIQEMKRISEAIEGKKMKSETWVMTSHPIAALSERLGYSKIIKHSGAEIVLDTCPVLCETIRDYNLMVTNSAKMAHYAPGLWNLKTSLVDLEKAIAAGENGYMEGK